MIRVLVPVAGFVLLNGQAGTVLAVAVIAICLAAYFQLQHFCRKQAHWWHTNGQRVKASVALSVLPLVLVGPLVMRHLLTITVVTSAQLMIYAVYRVRQTQAGEEYVEGLHGLVEANRVAAEIASAKAVAVASAARDRWESRPGRVRVTHDLEAACHAALTSADAEGVARAG
jgi:hypothetical protein